MNAETGVVGITILGLILGGLFIFTGSDTGTVSAEHRGVKVLEYPTDTGGSGAPLIFPQSLLKLDRRAEVVDDRVRIDYRIGEWDFETGGVMELTNFSVEDAEFTVDVPEGLRIVSREPAVETEPMDSYFSGDIERGEMIERSFTMEAERDGVWEVEAELVPGRYVTGEELLSNSTNPKTATVGIMRKEGELFVSDGNWCGVEVMNEETLECEPARAAPVEDVDDADGESPGPA